MKQEGDRDLIRKVLEGQATPSERIQLAETEEVEMIMKQQWDNNGYAPADTKIGKRIWKKIARQCRLDKDRPIRRKVYRWYAAGVVALLLAGGFWLAQENEKRPNIEYLSIIADEPRTLSLPDESKVWMQPGTSIRYAQEFDNNREVWLKGDAIFEVTKQADRPFRVYIDHVFIEVKGTAFRISNQDKDVSKVTLYNGRIDFHAEKDGKFITMRPSQCLTYRSNGEITVDSANNINWQNGAYKFSNTRLDSLTSIIRGISNTEIELSAGVPGYNRFGGMIRYDERPTEIAEKICYVMDLKYKKENNRLIIYKPRENVKPKPN
ncbi:MAG: FecR family protein [Bacteroides sp.]|nr:FecR family protein [Bacteroides sp.]